MNKQKIMKWALPALLMSALTFELMPGSVNYFAKGVATLPETAWNFFQLPTEGMAASCLTLAGAVTFLAMVLALVALCFKKKNMYKLISWCSLGAGSLASIPYLTGTAEELLQPNVVILLILVAAWLLALALSKKNEQKNDLPQSKHL